MSFDLRRALRRIRPKSSTTALPRRPTDRLRFVGAGVTIDEEVLIDTSVYIDVLQARAPTEVEDVVRLRSTNHLSVCLAELMQAFGRLDPATRKRPVLGRASAGW